MSRWPRYRRRQTSMSALVDPTLRLGIRTRPSSVRCSGRDDVKPDPGLVRDLKLILGEMVAARRQYRKAFLDRKARQVRRLRATNWLAALDRAVGRSVERKRAAADLLAELT